MVCGLAFRVCWLACAFFSGFRRNGRFYTQNYADSVYRLLLFYAVIHYYRQ